MNALLAAIMIGWALFTWAALIKIIPSCATSRFRYLLWKMRDDLVDEIRHGQYENVDQARRLVTEIEVAITHATELSVANVVLVTRFFKNVEMPRNLLLDLDALSSSDRQRLQPKQEVLYREMTWHLLIRKMSGWPVFVFLSVVALFSALFTELRSGISRSSTKRVYRDTKQQVRDDVDVEPVIAFFGTNRADRHLSARV